MVVVDRSALGATATEFNQGVASPEKEKSHEVQFGDTPLQKIMKRCKFSHFVLFFWKFTQGFHLMKEFYVSEIKNDIIYLTNKMKNMGLTLLSQEASAFWDNDSTPEFIRLGSFGKFIYERQKKTFML